MNSNPHNNMPKLWFIEDESHDIPKGFFEQVLETINTENKPKIGMLHIPRMPNKLCKFLDIDKD